MVRRCFICLADTLKATSRALVYANGRRRAFPLACASCGVLLDVGLDPDACRSHLEQSLTGHTFHLAPEAPYGLDLYTLRTAATAYGRGVRALCEADHVALLQPHSERAAAGEFFPLAPTDSTTVSLGLLCQLRDLDALLASLPPHACWSGDVTILLDALGSDPVSASVQGFAAGAVRIAARPLAGDFAAQRNVLQAMTRRPWMLQLDADEALAPETGALVPALAALAEAGDALSVGLPRRNRVDGVLSDVYPDVQYRLNHASVRYQGRVHERPDLGGDWRRGFIALLGAIEHQLSQMHVAARSRRYEALDPGRGRPEEEVALLRPYRP